MSVNEFDMISPFGDNSLEVVAEGVGPLTNLLIYPPNHILLLGFTIDRLVELHQARFAMVVDD